tara:strand:+ start:4680 stop:5351 length:672 start_codon:yes stop_codon:yes gene_type:complete
MSLLSTSKLINFKSNKKNNFFAPEWDYYIIESVIQKVDFKKLKNLFLSKESEILKLPIIDEAKSDAYTGLGLNNTHARYSQYNIFTWRDNEIEKIKKSIIELHNKLLNYLKLEIPNNLYAQCWVNIMRKNEEIKPHLHGLCPDTYLGGTICVQASNTDTIYMNAVNQINDPELYISKNETGKISIFQGCLPHYTSKHKDDEERITIAFDLSLIQRNSNFISIL